MPLNGSEYGLFRKSLSKTLKTSHWKLVSDSTVIKKLIGTPIGKLYRHL